VRREERTLVDWYRALVRAALPYLGPATHALVREIAALPDGIRGFEELKLRSAARERDRGERLMRRLEEATAASHSVDESQRQIAAG
jgi:indolepyruvate ferredoxin oxidoreductase